MIRDSKLSRFSKITEQSKKSEESKIILIQAFIKRKLSLNKLKQMKTQKIHEYELYIMIQNAFSKFAKYHKFKTLQLLFENYKNVNSPIKPSPIHESKLYKIYENESTPKSDSEEHDHPAILLREDSDETPEAKKKRYSVYNNLKFSSPHKPYDLSTKKMKEKNKMEIVKQMKNLAFAEKNKKILQKFIDLIKLKILQSTFNKIYKKFYLDMNIIQKSFEKINKILVTKLIKNTLFEIKPKIKPTSIVKTTQILKGILKTKTQLCSEKSSKIAHFASTPLSAKKLEKSIYEQPSIHLVKCPPKFRKLTEISQTENEQRKITEFGAALRIQHAYKEYKFKKFITGKIHRSEKQMDESCVVINPDLNESKNSGCFII